MAQYGERQPIGYPPAIIATLSIERTFPFLSIQFDASFHIRIRPAN
jgi:hypothetical protein